MSRNHIYFLYRKDKTLPRMPQVSSDLVHRINPKSNFEKYFVVCLKAQAVNGTVCGIVFEHPTMSMVRQVQNFPELDLPTLATRAESAFEANPGEAIPYMLEIRTRLTMAMSEEYRTIYRENIYMLGLAHMKWFQQTQDKLPLKDGIPFWNEFIQEFLDDKRHPLAMLNLGDSYYGIEDYNEAIRVYRHVLEIYSQQLGSEELLGSCND